MQGQNFEAQQGYPTGAARNFMLSRRLPATFRCRVPSPLPPFTIGESSKMTMKRINHPRDFWGRIKMHNSTEYARVNSMASQIKSQMCTPMTRLNGAQCLRNCQFRAPGSHSRGHSRSGIRGPRVLRVKPWGWSSSFAPTLAWVMFKFTMFKLR